MLGGQRFTAAGIVGKNFSESTNLNTDITLFYERSLRPMVGNNRTFNPSFYVSFRRREIDNLLSSQRVVLDTVASSTVVASLDSTNLLLIPDAEQHRSQLDSREDLFKSIFENFALGINLPLTRRQRLSFQYLRRNYDENWKLRSLSSQNNIFFVQDGVAISPTVYPTICVARTSP